MTNTVDQLAAPRVALRLAFGLVPLLAGLDKFTNLLTDWSQYLAPPVRALLPIAPQTFLEISGVIEVLVGIAILTRWTEIGSYVAAAWLTLIAANLVLAGYFDVAIRDLVMAVGAFTLARLTAVAHTVEVQAAEPLRARERLVA
ncbi:MAG: hypothetical protein ABI629_07200 [bacterium]